MLGFNTASRPWLLVLGSIVGLHACGTSASTLAPELPGDGTEHLPLEPDTGATETQEKPDPWRGRELITPPAPSLPGALELPEVVRFKLKNGLEVIAVQDSTLPVTTLQLAVRAGKRQVPREQVGLAEFAAQTMARGTKLRNAARIAKEVEAVGGELQSTSSYEATLLSCKTMSKDMRTCLTVLSDVVANASFPESEVDLVRRNLHATVRSRLDDAGQLASAHFQSALWGEGHIRGAVMSSATIDAISREDLIAWHKAQVLPNNSVLAVAGDFDAKKIQGELERTFGKWRTADVPKLPKVELPELRGLRIRLVDKPGQTQSHIRLGHLGIAHSDPEFYSTQVFNYTLGGGGFASRLVKTIRSNEGKAYTASSSFDRNREMGAFIAATFTRSEETVATVKLMQSVIAEMAKSGPTTEEVSAAKSNLAGSYAMRFESASDFASAILAADLHDFTESYVGLYPEQIGKVSQAEAAKSAARVLDTMNGVLVIVGDAKVVGPQLAAAGWGFETLSFQDPISDWERTKASEAGNASEDPKAVEAATKLLDEALATKGGAKKLAALKSFHWTGDAQLNLPTGAMAAEVEKHYLAPDKLRLDMSIGGGQIKIVTALSAAAGWAMEESPRGKQVRDFAAPELGALTNQLWRDSELVLLRHTEQGSKVTPLGDRDVAGKKAQAIGVTSADGRSVILLIDATTKLLVGMEYSDQGMKTTEGFDDYKNVGGLQVAHIRSTKGPQVDLGVKIKKFEVNSKVPATLFARPADPAAAP